MLPSETMIWQPEFTDKTLSRKPGAVQTSAGRPSWMRAVCAISGLRLSPKCWPAARGYWE
ncbi:hypothetical protein GH770_25180 (plasmid) [Shigella dysenteriae]|nr:hypothetical protein GH770_25180 [Shigella dysenteriae]